MDVTKLTPIMLEFNLVEYLLTKFPTSKFTVNGFSAKSPDNTVMISRTGGEVQHWYDRTDWQIQILTRDNNPVDAAIMADKVYKVLLNRFGLELPETAILSPSLPAVKTWQISPIQTPSYIGEDEAGRTIVSFNVIITTGKETK